MPCNILVGKLNHAGGSASNCVYYAAKNAGGDSKAIVWANDNTVIVGSAITDYEKGYVALTNLTPFEITTPIYNAEGCDEFEVNTFTDELSSLIEGEPAWQL